MYCFLFSSDDIVGPDDDLSNFTVQDDAFDELQAVVNRTMKLKTKKDGNATEKVRISSFDRKETKHILLSKYRHCKK